MTTALNGFLKRVERYPLLKRDEEALFLQQAWQGCQKAKNALVNHNLRLVVRVAQPFWHPGAERMDLIQEGNVGLIKAANKAAGASNYRFAAYARPWIKGEIIRFLVEDTTLIRLPREVWSEVNEYKKQKSRLSRKLGRDPSMRELDDHFEKSIVAKLESISHLDKLSAECPEREEDLTILDQVEKIEQMDRLEKSVLKLPKPDREAMIHRLGLFGEMPKGINEICVLLNFNNHQYASLILKRGKEKLQRMVACG